MYTAHQRSGVQEDRANNPPVAVPRMY